MNHFMRAAVALGRLALLPGRLVIYGINSAKAVNGVGPLGRFQRGVVHAFLGLIALIGLSMGSAAESSTAQLADRPAAAPVAVSVGQQSRGDWTAPATPVAVPHPPIASDGVRVVEVVDGDTFKTGDGRTIRVLGIDSCEMSTPGGPLARDEAIRLLQGTVHLLTEPGVTTDRYGRHLRYVQTSTGDFGLAMVRHTHTADYRGRNDASPQYMSKLRAVDGDPDRACGDEVAPAPKPQPKPEPRPAPKPEVEVDAPKASGPFKSCAAARAAGAAPVRVGDPGYSRKLDRDGDGVGCE